MHYLYKILCIINKKIYIGQTVNPSTRWSQHKNEAKKDNPSMIINRAMKKHGIQNFIFEIVATCLTQDNANELETLLVSQYESHISTSKGYNVSAGGSNAPKSEEWKKSMKEWRDNLSVEEKEEIKQKQREATIKQIETQGHPAQGTKRTPEQSQRLSQARKDNPVIYTEEIRQRMSEAHLGHKPSEETLVKRSESMKLVWAEKHRDEEIKCNATGCDVVGPAHYLIVNGIRYCNKHGLRLKNTGTLDLIPFVPSNKGKPMPDEIRKKCGLANIGKVPHNKIHFTDEQIAAIMVDSRSNEDIAKSLGLGKNTIQKLRRSQKLKNNF